MASDNGAPFASPHALFGLSKLLIWWLRLGIRIERIKPGNPNIQENVIRYNNDEKKIADRLRADIFEKLKLKMTKRELAYPTPNYVSVFFCSS